MTLVSPTNKGGYKQDFDRPAYTTKRVFYSLKRMGSINYLELYRSAYTTKRLWYRLQRMRFMNYLEFYTSAYTDKRLGCRLQTMVVINKSLIDLHTPLNDFGITYKEGGL